MIGIPYLIILLVLLVVISAFFSGSETGMMSLNRYRLRHLERKGDPVAQRVAQLLSRPDRILGVILIGNTFANILASALATMIAVHYFGDVGVLIATLLLTLVILIFAETTPKTLAALYPEKVAFPASLPLRFLLKAFYPLVWLVNGIANGLLRLFGVDIKKRGLDPLSVEELRTLVNEASGKISANYRQILLRILEFEQVTVEDVMVPKAEIVGIDLDADWEQIIQQLGASRYGALPLYRGHIDQVEGVLHLRQALLALHGKELTRDSLLALAEKVYFVPEGALLNQQLLNFQEQQRSVGLVVDEYGDIQGLVTLQDVLEEIVGEFSAGADDTSRLVQEEKGGAVLIDGRINIRDLNRSMAWTLPTEGAKTLGGLVIEYLESIPQADIGLRIAGYPIEVVKVSNNRVRLVRIWPALYVDPSAPDG